jgi:hypothetical protein
MRNFDWQSVEKYYTEQYSEDNVNIEGVYIEYLPAIHILVIGITEMKPESIEKLWFMEWRPMSGKDWCEMEELKSRLRIGLKKLWCLFEKERRWQRKILDLFNNLLSFSVIIYNTPNQGHS